MTDHPILFSAPMVRALLAGRKTHTRRIIKFAGIQNVMDFVKVATTRQGQPVYEMKDSQGQFVARPAGKHLVDYRYSPPYSVGDRLWVKETWRVHGWATDVAAIMYRANERGSYTEMTAQFPIVGREYIAPSVERWRSPLHMFRWLSRITLLVTDVRVERLQDISETDAVSEGCFKGKASGRVFDSLAAMHFGGSEWANARDWYADLWETINGAGAWDANPWIVAYTFSVHLGNIDQIGRAA